MKKRSDIFKNLRDHPVAPPPGVKSSLFHSLRIWIREENGEDRGPVLAFLRETVISPPGRLADAVFSSLAARRSVDPPTGGPLLTRLQVYRLAAASLLLIIAGWGLFGKFHARPVPVYASPLAAASPAPQTSPAKAEDQPFPAADTLSATTEKSPPGTPDTALLTRAKAPNYFRNTGIRAGNKQYPLTDNDLFITLTGFRYNEVPAFLLEDENAPVRIGVDHYSSITISADIHAMMKRMYTYRPNGLPTRKARKERERLEEWKKADEKVFDGSGKNPLDPIDLAESLFK